MHARVYPMMSSDVKRQSGTSELDDIDSLVRMYRPRLLRFVSFSIGDQDLAESITQDCFLKAYRARDRFRGECSAFTWLTSIAINLIKDQQRAAKFRFWRQASKTAVDVASLAPMLSNGEASPERRLLAKEQASRVAEVIETLSANQKRVFLMRFVEEMTPEEICLATGMTPATMKTHMHRAVKAVRLKVGARS